MLVRTREELERGVVVRLRFCLPGEEACFTTRGRVVHTSEDERRTERRWRSGIEFLGVEFEDREHLVRYTLWREREIRRREVGLDPSTRPPRFPPWRACAGDGEAGDGPAG
jgi:c-di-GMP-binding flagellar brake protein YcgR